MLPLEEDNICKGCHSTDWTEKHFDKMDNTIKETDRMTLEATKLMMFAWEEGYEEHHSPEEVAPELDFAAE